MDGSLDGRLRNLAVLPQTPFGRGAAWALERLPVGGDLSRASELADALCEHWRAAPRIARWLSVHTMGAAWPLTIKGAPIDESGRRWVDVEDANAKAWRLRLELHTDGRIHWIAFCRVLPQDLRVASFDIPPVDDMVTLERRVALEVELGPVTIDRTRSVADHVRLLGDVQVVMTYDHAGTPVAMHFGAKRVLPVAPGRLKNVVYEGRTRIDPAVRRHRLLSAMIAASDGDIVRWVDFGYGVVDATNELMRTTMEAYGAKTWCDAKRFWFDTAQVADATDGRRCDPEDAGEIAELLERTHGNQWLWPGAGGLIDRLSRTPAYSWHHLRRTDSAVVGTWMANERRTTNDVDGPAVTTRCGLILDYGYDADAEADLAGLIRSACADARAAGMDELSVVASAGSPGRRVFAELSTRREDLIVNSASDVDPPHDLAERGMWLDPIYI